MNIYRECCYDKYSYKMSSVYVYFIQSVFPKGCLCVCSYIILPYRFGMFVAI